MSIVGTWIDDVPQPPETSYEFLSSDLVRFTHHYRGMSIAEMWRYTLREPGHGVLHELIDVQVTEWWDGEDEESDDDY